MRCIIAGSRTVVGAKSYESLKGAMRMVTDCMGWPVITEIVSGGARGADMLGERWARENGVPVKVIRPDWSKGRGAGFDRNVAMVKYVTSSGDDPEGKSVRGGCVILHDGRSKGSWHMLQAAQSADMYVFYVKVDLPGIPPWDGSKVRGI